MAYNLLLDTEFKGGRWKYINCEKIGEKTIRSKGKVFGIEQELILPDPTKLYFRCEYKTNNKIEETNIGIQTEDILEINRKSPKVNKWQSISVVDEVKQEKIILHLIFESKENINEVEIKNPILIDLNYLNKSRWLRFVLDKTIRYRYGYRYENMYENGELKKDIPDLKNVDCIEDAKIGSIIKTKQKITIEINAKFMENKYYLAKLDYKEINKFGRVYLTYGVVESTYFQDEQLYLLFKGNDKNKLILNIEGCEELLYQINLKHLLLIKVGGMNLLKSDIPYLPFI